MKTGVRKHSIKKDQIHGKSPSLGEQINRLGYVHITHSYSGTGFPGGSDGKASVYNVGDLGLIPESGRSSGEGNGNSLQYSCLENPMDRGAWL